MISLNWNLLADKGNPDGRDVQTGFADWIG
jgi:hypothetical protein